MTYGYADIARDINVLADFCGPRDIARPDRDSLRAAFGIERADVMVLFGGSIVAGGDVLAEGMRAGVARRYMIVGGAGHTTQTLRDMMHGLHPDIDVDGRCEADIFADYLAARYGLRPDLLERESTNCGNNITNMLDVLCGAGVPCGSAILVQDASMQRRMSAGLSKYAPKTTVVNYAAYRTRVRVTAGDGAATVTGVGGAAVCGMMEYDNPQTGMWRMERYVNLLMGEIPRLRDDANGYGPAGRGYITHVDVPDTVLAAHARLCTVFGTAGRAANPAFASKE
ncbi:YdcF family protein [Bifidobacterium aerophilum]|uniref:YdcF family protein n=1 Tax=Bifidobacterium aerophilum TaxID=1798155 RepID=A0A6N9Z6E8_9BIFI|nr:YdcF family protein [Bifidobacterium aerophilum]NEG90026.1 YdcF family protein [Bifidobacterium aerophilum]